MPNLGRKFSCYSCHTKFYDLGKASPLCPKCGADQREADVAPATTSHRSRRAPVVVEEPPPIEEEFEAEEDVGAAPEEEEVEIIGPIEKEEEAEAELEEEEEY